MTLTTNMVALIFLGWQIDGTGLSVPVIFVGLALAFVGTVHGRLRKHYLAIAGGCFLFACARPLGVSVHARDVGLDVLIGLGVITAGWGDHLVLRRVLGASRGEDYGTARRSLQLGSAHS